MTALEEAQPAHGRINFNLRPNKRIERKLIAEALNCIYRYDTPRRFGYIGMGSYYFSDFTLFHRHFGIDRMVSIEKETGDQERFDFNKPYACIQMEWGTTHERLPLLGIFDEAPVICWLDYYGRLSSAILGDVDTFFARAQLGSALILTLNCKPPGARTVSEFTAGLPKGWEGIVDKSLMASKRGLGDLMLTLIESRIEESLARLNGAVSPRRSYRRIANIHYQDGAPMVSFGWLLLDDARAARLDDEPNAMDAPATRSCNPPMAIEAPALTFREIAHLRSLLPMEASAPFFRAAKPIPEELARRFAELYRYYPSFADVEE